MLHLDEWNSVEDDYSGSLSGITTALQDASLRLPITDDVKVRYLFVHNPMTYVLFLGLIKDG